MMNSLDYDCIVSQIGQKYQKHEKEHVFFLLFLTSSQVHMTDQTFCLLKYIWNQCKFIQHTYITYWIYKICTKIYTL